VGDILEIAYGSGDDFPQYAALHLDSSYLRLINAPDAEWGTAIVLLPAYWSGGTYYQGAPVTVDWQVVGEDLVLDVQGVIGGLSAQLTVGLMPPAQERLVVQVAGEIQGDVAIDPRPGEAFKHVMLTSMHISPTIWDAQSAFGSCITLPLPAEGWIVQLPQPALNFGLDGGTSDWKANAPTIEILLAQPRLITGWVTASTDPDNDNVGFWAAADSLLSSYQYTAFAAAGRQGLADCTFLPLAIRQH
jgi:hypothetical protein